MHIKYAYFFIKKLEIIFKVIYNSNIVTYKINKKEKKMEGSITFVRQKQYYGSLVPINVYVDGKVAGTLGIGKSFKFNTTVGKHHIAFDLWSGNEQYDVEIKEENPNIQIEFKLNFGLITSKPKIVSVTNI